MDFVWPALDPLSGGPLQGTKQQTKTSSGRSGFAFRSGWGGGSEGLFKCLLPPPNRIT